VSNARKVFAVALVAALAWVVAPVAEAQPPIRIGASLAQTGVTALLGQNQLRGYQLCVNHMNDKGGVLGRKLELVLYDDGSDPATAVRLYEKLITQDKVDLVLGPYGSPISEAVAGVTEKHKKEFPGAEINYPSAAGYGGCQILAEAIRRAGSLDSEKLREAILGMDYNTVFGGFRVDRDGLQLAHKALIFQWQDGKKVLVWPEELAPDKPRFPTPPWSQRP
jgi:ABC-type branched-subunit amino acid transport system substrate-binding protein